MDDSLKNKEELLKELAELRQRVKDLETLEEAQWRADRERKQMEEKLQRERILLKTLINNLPDGIYVKDTETRKLVSNPADYIKNVGKKTEEEVLGKTDFDFFPKELAEKFFEDDQSVLKTGQPILNREEFVLHENGGKRWLLTSKLPLKDQSG
jgi:PAS domain S-box-containing protein